MTLDAAISYARSMGDSFARRTGRTQREREAGTHMVVIYTGAGCYLARYATEVPEEDPRQVWDSIVGMISVEQRERWAQASAGSR